MKSKFGLIVLLQIFCFAQAEVTTVSHVDLSRYIGKWYEVAGIPQFFQKKCVANTTAEYTLLEDGAIQVDNSCETKSGERSQAKGRAKVVDSETNSKLKVTFVKILGWIWAFGGNYWILDVDEDYSYALVGDPSAKYAWILSRTSSLQVERFLAAEKKFKSMGYDTCQILTSVQAGGCDRRIPLCELDKESSQNR